MDQIDLDWLISSPIAHRGFYDNKIKLPENTIPAFERAIQAGYLIELDVQVIADQEIVVFHDYTLERLCGRKGRVADLTRNDLTSHFILETEYTIPQLEYVLKLIDGQVPLLIEIKRQPDVKNANMIILNSLIGYRGKYAIMSFDPFVLGWFAKNAPLIPRGQLSSNFKDEPISSIQKYLLKNFMFNFISQPHFIAYDIHDMPNKLVANKRRNGSKVLGWTVTTQQEYQNISALCDNIIFEEFQPANI